MIARGVVLLGLINGAAACGDSDSETDLNPDGPPMIRQVFVSERRVTNNVGRIYPGQLAFGTHPDITDDGLPLTTAIAVANPIRIVVDELLLGNNLEEIECADGSFSRVPVDATPDDIAKCAGAANELERCTGPNAVCIVGGIPVGIKDVDLSGSADSHRFIDGVVKVNCDGVEVGVDLTSSFYQPAGNQLIPAGTGFNGLGPALVVTTTGELPTSKSCTFLFDAGVVDKDGNKLCAPPGGDIRQVCPGDGDVSLVSFGVEPLSVTGSTPQPGAQNTLPVTPPGNGVPANVFRATLTFAASVDETSLDGQFDLQTGGASVAGVQTIVNPMNHREVFVQVPGGLAGGTEYELVIGTGVTDSYASPMPQPYTLAFKTSGGSTPTPDAGVPDAGAEVDAGTPDAADVVDAAADVDAN
jgi:Big-like domain-containing protein